MVVYGMVWYGMVWCGMVWYGGKYIGVAVRVWCWHVPLTAVASIALSWYLV